MITTKRAKTGELALEYDLEYGIEKPTVQPNYVGAQRYMAMANELAWNDVGNNNNQYPIYTKDLIGNYPYESSISFGSTIFLDRKQAN